MVASAATVNKSRPRPITVRHVVCGHSAAAVAAGDTLAREVMPLRGKITGVWAYGAVAGTGTGNTVLDVLVNGRSIWADYSNAPYLLATDTAVFVAVPPTSGLRDVKPGDIVQIRVPSVSTSGHARLSAAAAIEMR